MRAEVAAEVPTLDRLLERAERHPRGSREGLRFVDRHEGASHHPWQEVVGRARRVAAGLAERGLEPGECVALVLPTGLEFFDAFFGVLLAGGVPAPLYPPPRLGRREEWLARTAGMLAAVSVRQVLTDERSAAAVAAALEAGGAGERAAVSAVGEVALLGASSVSSFTPPLRAADDLALIQFSSGTTVDPKPVALSHRALLAQAQLLGALFPDRDGVPQSGVSWLPLYHDMGLIGCVLPSLDRPADLTLIAPELFVVRPALWLRTLSRYRATVSPAPNFAYALCLERIEDRELDGVDLSSWQVAFNGAETVVPEVMRRFVRRFGPRGLRAEALTPVYGLAEATLAVTASAVERPFSSRRFDRAALARGEASPGDPGKPPTASLELASLGPPVAGFAIEIRDADGRRCAAGRVGRVWTRGPSLMAGYLGRPRETAAVLRDGWLDTGDLGFELDGELFLTGRAKDVLLLRGRNHAPEGVEQAAQRVEGVRSMAAVAVSEPSAEEGSERLVVLVERRGAADAAAELGRQVKQRVLAEVGLAANEVVVLEPGSLPRTSSGKLRRAEALRRWRDGELQAAAVLEEGGGRA